MSVLDHTRLTAGADETLRWNHRDLRHPLRSPRARRRAGRRAGGNDREVLLRLPPGLEPGPLSHSLADDGPREAGPRRPLAVEGVEHSLTMTAPFAPCVSGRRTIDLVAIARALEPCASCARQLLEELELTVGPCACGAIVHRRCRVRGACVRCAGQGAATVEAEQRRARARASLLRWSPVGVAVVGAAILYAVWLATR